MRLGLVIYGSLETISGGYLYDRQLVNHLRRQGDEVEVLTLPWRNYPAHLADNFRPEWIKRLRAARVDLLLQDELNHPSLALANRRAWPRDADGPPRVAIVHHLRASEARPAWQNAFYRLIEGHYLRSVQGFIVNSVATRTAVQRLAGISRPALVAYPAGDRFAALSPEQIRRRAAGPGPLRLLFVGNLIPRKGLDTLLDALETLGSGWNLTIVGSPESDRVHAAHIQTRVAGKLAGRVQILGALEDDALAERYVRSDLLVVPSSYEGFGIVYLEGMAAGLPAIATTAGAAGEIITPGLDGYLIAPGDSAALAGRLRALVADRDLLLKLSLAARRRFAAHPAWEDSLSAIRGFLQGFASG
jgi:glycosyltransferase involved in cell wall biosynthesis